MSDDQSGYWDMPAADRALLKSINNNMHAGGTFCDLAKMSDYKSQNFVN